MLASVGGKIWKLGARNGGRWARCGGAGAPAVPACQACALGILATAANFVSPRQPPAIQGQGQGRLVLVGPGTNGVSCSAARNESGEGRGVF